MGFLSSLPNRLSDFSGKGWSKNILMEHTGFEPVASTMRMLRAPNCANAPELYLLYHMKNKKSLFILIKFCVLN